MLSTYGLRALGNMTGVTPHLRKLITSSSMKTASITPVSTPRVHSGGKKGSVIFWLDWC